MTMVQQNFHFNTQAHYSSLGFVTAQEIQNTTNNKKKTEAKPWLGRFPAPSNVHNVSHAQLMNTG